MRFYYEILRLFTLSVSGFNVMADQCTYLDVDFSPSFA